jgi:hypothetical protein
MALAGRLLLLLLTKPNMFLNHAPVKTNNHNQNNYMNIIRRSMFACLLAFSALQLASLNSYASQVLINAFNTADEVNNNNGNPWGNWFGTAYYQVLWSTNDAQGNVNSGSMEIQAIYPDSGIGGCCGPQFVAYNQNNGINPPLAGNGAGGVVATNVEFDVQFDPSTTIISGGNWPTIEVGTRGVDFNQYDFGTFTIPVTQTGWVHVSLPITPNASWATIPNIYFKYYSTVPSGAVTLFVDNIVFDESQVTIAPPTMAIQKPNNALRVFAGSTAQTYDREQLTSIDQNQSWVGGTYPVSYSFTLKSFPTPTSTNQLFRYHIFLVPVNNAAGNSFSNNEFIEYQANNDLWLNISATNPTNILAEVAWKTNLPNSNPNVEVVSNYYSTVIGTWTLTFDSATSGSLTAPGAVAQSFTIDDANIVADFGNPLVAFFGVQPDSGWGEGQYADVTTIKTLDVASPGVQINSDFTTANTIDTNVWDVSNSALPASLIVVPAGSAWWLNWGYPDTGFTLETGTNVAASDASGDWSTPAYYANYNTNALWQKKMGNNVWSLIPQVALPTVNGMSNGAASPIGFFRLTTNTPAQ